MGAEVDGRFLPLMFVLGTVLAVSATVVILHRLFSTHGGMAYMHGVRATQGGDASSGIPQYKEAPWESYCRCVGTHTLSVSCVPSTFQPSRVPST